MSNCRAPKGFTYDQCHGCGEVPQAFYPRPRDGVCSICREVLKAHSKALAEAQDMSLVAVGIPEQAHRFPYIHHDTSKLQDRFHAVVMLVSVPANEAISQFDESNHLIPNTDRSSSYWSPCKKSDFRSMPKPLAIALRALYEGMTESVEGAFKRGKSEGVNFLELTLNAKRSNRNIRLHC